MCITRAILFLVLGLVFGNSARIEADAGFGNLAGSSRVGKSLKSLGQEVSSDHDEADIESSNHGRSIYVSSEAGPRGGRFEDESKDKVFGRQGIVPDASELGANNADALDLGGLDMESLELEDKNSNSSDEQKLRKQLEDGLDITDPELARILPFIVDTGLALADREYLLMKPTHPLQSPKLFALGAWEGYLPMGAGKGVELLVLKIHQSRTVISPPNRVHVSQNSKDAAARYRLTVDEAFEEVVKGIQNNTFYQDHTFTRNSAGDLWLTDDLAELYQAVNRLPADDSKGVRFHSVELWDVDSGELVAGQIGYSVGSIYTSCTGFAKKKEFPGCGALAMVALGKWLAKCGFQLWDLAEKFEYKTALGGQEQPRSMWAASVRKFRSDALDLPSPPAGSTVEDLLIIDLTGPIITNASLSAATTEESHE